MKSTTTLKSSAAAILTALAIAVPATSAHALATAGMSRDVGTVAGARLPVVKPVAQLFTGLAVTTDSVVATATITYTGNPGTVSVQWGDNTTSARNLNSPLPPVVGATQDPPGTVIFKHAYAAPADGMSFVVAIVAMVGAEQQVRAATITPRFRVIQYQAYFSPLSHCDSAAEGYTEWRIQQTMESNGSSGATKTWRQDRKTATGWYGAYVDFQPDFNPRVLEGSQFSQEMTMADAHVLARYKITELDPFFDDEAGTRKIDLHPSLGTRAVDLEFDDDSGCKARITADVEVALLKPGLNTGGGGLALAEGASAPAPIL